MQRLLLWQKKKNKRIAEAIKEEPFMKIALGSQMREMDRITTEEYLWKMRQRLLPKNAWNI